MCMACIEYAKDALTQQEFQTALREITMEDKEHADEVVKIFKDHAGKPEEIKRQLKLLAEK